MQITTDLFKRKVKDLKTKIRVVFIPFLIVSAATIIVYNIFRWIFDIKLGILPLKQDLLNYWIPFVLSIITVRIWLRNGTRILGKWEDRFFMYHFIMSLAIAIPLIISQLYLEKGSFDLYGVSGIDKVRELKKEKYYVIRSFKVDHGSNLQYFTSRTSGRHGQYLNFYLYFVSPFEDSDSIWYGLEYRKIIRSGLSKQKKDAEYRSFRIDSEKDFKNHDFQYASYFEKLNYSNDRDGFLEAIKGQNPNMNKNEHLILVPKFENFEDRHGSSFSLVLRSFGICALIVLLAISVPKLDHKELDDLKKNIPLKEDEYGLKYYLRFLNPMGEHKAMAILSLVNILVFLIMTLSGLNIISPTAKELLEIGGSRRFEVLNGEYWRLLTSGFIHAGFPHLLLNLFGLGLANSLLKNVLGSTKLITIYITCGLLASLASVYWYENTVSVGASGAVFGLFGLILAFTVFKIFPKYTRTTAWDVLIFCAVSLIFGFFLGGIDNAAHFGGLISGFMIGGILILTKNN